MRSNTFESEGPNWFDVAELKRVIEAQHGLRTRMTLLLAPSKKPAPVIEVELYLASSLIPTAALARSVAYTTYRDPNVRGSLVYHALVTALSTYTNDPWVWTAQTRALHTHPDSSPVAK